VVQRAGLSLLTASGRAGKLSNRVLRHARMKQVPLFDPEWLASIFVKAVKPAKSDDAR
jgi:hypothetical protein